MMGKRRNYNNIFFISDLHLGHYNIIKYCNRPFNSLEEMNCILIDNWNKTVSKDNTVYFLGDLGMHQDWKKYLNGNIIHISGNHEFSYINTYQKKIVYFDNIRFLLIHNPNNMDLNRNGWLIHGHKHNNNLKQFPFINYPKKTINVSCELIDYKPINIKEIIKNITKLSL